MIYEEHMDDESASFSKNFTHSFEAQSEKRCRYNVLFCEREVLLLRGQVQD